MNYSTSFVTATPFKHFYSKPNLNAKLDKHPLLMTLMTAAPHNPFSHREMMAEIFFETFRAPALFLAPPAVLSPYASGRTTGWCWTWDTG